MTYTEKLIENLEVYRRRENLTYLDLQDQTGLSAGTLNRLINGVVVYPRRRTVERIEKFLKGGGKMSETKPTLSDNIAQLNKDQAGMLLSFLSRLEHVIILSVEVNPGVQNVWSNGLMYSVSRLNITIRATGSGPWEILHRPDDPAAASESKFHFLHETATGEKKILNSLGVILRQMFPTASINGLG